MRINIKQDPPQAWWAQRNQALANNTPIASLDVLNHKIEACVVFDHGNVFGVFSWHGCMDDAKHNAKLIGGKAIPTDSMDGYVMLPACVIARIRKVFER